MTIDLSISIPAMLSKLSEEEQHRFYDAAMRGEPMPEDIRQRLVQLDQEAQVGTG